MARPKKAVVEYFPHYCNHKKTIFILENLYGNDGYAFWFKLLEILASEEGHSYDYNNESSWQFLLAKTRVSGVIAAKIIETLANLGAIDPDLIKSKVLWSQNFVDNLDVLYSRRSIEKPVKPYKNPAERDKCIQKPHSEGVSASNNPQSKVEESKVKESRDSRTIFIPPILQQTKDYFLQTLNHTEISAERFWNHYEANGWLIGRNKMKDWQAAARTWKLKDIEWGGNNATNKRDIGKTDAKFNCEQRTGLYEKDYKVGTF